MRNQIIGILVGVVFIVVVSGIGYLSSHGQMNEVDHGLAWPKKLQPGMAIQEVQKHVPLTLVKKFKGFNVYIAPVDSFNTDGLSLIRSEVLINSTDSTLISLRMWFNPLSYESRTLSLEAYAAYKYGKSKLGFENGIESYRQIFDNYTVSVGRCYRDLDAASYNIFCTPHGWGSGFFYIEGIIFDSSKLDWDVLEWKADSVQIEQVLNGCGNLDL